MAGLLALPSFLYAMIADFLKALFKEFFAVFGIEI